MTLSTTALSPTERSTLRRHRERARSERAELHALLDTCLVCHLGFVVDGAPVVLPTGYGRDGDTLYLHGSSGAASLLTAAAGAPVCVTVTRMDAVVYARSVFSHSMNYASAVVHGVAHEVTGDRAKIDGLRVIVEHLAPGSWDHARQPTRRELAATRVLALPLAEASLKVRTGPPADDEPAAAAWAGVLPIIRGWGTPEPCPRVPAGKLVPPHVRDRSALTPSP